MGHERLKHIENNLVSAVEAQICNLSEVDVDELGGVIDMIKDLEEAIYYCTITEAMQGKGDQDFEMEWESKSKKYGKDKEEYMMFYTEPRMYNRMPYYDNSMMEHDGARSYYGGSSGGGRSGGSSSGGGRGGSSSSNSGGGGSSSSGGGNSGGGSSSSNFSEPMTRDMREGRSPQSRRMYMEAKQNHQDKATQLRELEKYMQELSQDLVEMIDDATPEEKQYLEKKMSALASKIGQMK